MKAKGKILVCLNSDNYYTTTDMSFEVARAGGIGVIAANNISQEIIAAPHVLPATHVNFEQGNHIFTYINQTRSPVASISAVKTELGITPAPIIASFSSRGPSVIEPGILKPDITAPGVSIIAAYSGAIPPTTSPNDKRTTPFLTDSGTSMSCPHVAGLAGLIKSLHPDWSPAAIKSAIMTTATIKDNTGGPILNFSLQKATPFDYGAGHIQPNLAADPGLVYDLDITDYLNFLCAHGYNTSIITLFYGKPYICPKSFNMVDFNYPSITVPHFDPKHSMNVSRTLTNVGPPSTYRVEVEAPPELLISVEPKLLTFKEIKEKKQFTITFTLKPLHKFDGDYFFGSLDWIDEKHHVKSPIAIKNPFS